MFVAALELAVKLGDLSVLRLDRVFQESLADARDLEAAHGHVRICPGGWCKSLGYSATTVRLTSPADLAGYLEDKGMEHVRGAPHHPQTQGKIERWHQTMKNRVLLENYFLPSDLERQIGAFIGHYNNH